MDVRSGDGKRYDVTARAAASELGVHVETLKRWCREHRVDARKNFVGAWMFSQGDIDRLLTPGDEEAAS
jgi:predicted site-specific integrase-resolvase